MDSRLCGASQRARKRLTQTRTERLNTNLCSRISSVAWLEGSLVVLIGVTMQLAFLLLLKLMLRGPIVLRNT